MNLSKQIYLLFFIILSAIFIFFTGNLVGIEYHLEQYAAIGELKSELRDVGDKFSKHIVMGDLKSFVKIVDGVLESNKYKSIKIVSAKGKVLFNKEVKIDEGVYRKNWILDRYKILNSKINMPIILKEDKIATIDAEIFKEYFQSMSWKNIKPILMRILYLFLSFIFISCIGLFFVLKPVRKILLHIKKMSERRSFTDNEIHYATDMQDAAERLNKLSLKLDKSFNENNEFCQMIRRNVYQDKLTGLPNVAYFTTHLEQMLSCSESGIGGLVMLLGFEVAGLSEEIIKSIVARLNEVAKDREKISNLSYFGEVRFAFIVKDVEPDKDGLENQAKEYCEFLIAKLSKIKLSSKKEITPQVCLGVTEYQQGTFVDDLLQQADDSLEKALSKGGNNWVKSDKSSKLSLLPNLDWKEYFKKLLVDENYILQYQPVYYYEKDGTLLFHNETFVRIKGVGKEFIFSGTFLPIAMKENLGVALDSSIISTLLTRIKDNEEGWQRYGVNISYQSLQSAKFLKWLKKKLKGAGEYARRLTFEFKEEDARNNVKHLKNFIDVVSKFGVQVGIDHFGCDFSEYTYLEHLDIAYIKIDGSYTRRIQSNPDNQTIIRSFIEVAHNMDMLVFATCVETEEERVELRNLSVDGMQGFWIGQPI